MKIYFDGAAQTVTGSQHMLQRVPEFAGEHCQYNATFLQGLQRVRTVKERHSQERQQPYVRLSDRRYI